MLYPWATLRPEKLLPCPRQGECEALSSMIDYTLEGLKKKSMFISEPVRWGIICSHFTKEKEPQRGWVPSAEPQIETDWALTWPWTPGTPNPKPLFPNTLSAIRYKCMHVWCGTVCVIDMCAVCGIYTYVWCLCRVHMCDAYHVYDM